MAGKIILHPNPAVPLQGDARNAAYALLSALLVSLFFVNGAASNAIAIIAFVAAWVLIVRDHRAGSLTMPPLNPVLLVFAIIISLRILLPPYGVTGAPPGAAITRILLLVGLYGLTLYVYARLPFSHILWMIVSAAALCALAAIFAHMVIGHESRLEFFGRASHAIAGAGAIATGVTAAAALLFAAPSQDRTKWGILSLLGSMALLVAALYFTGSRGPILALSVALIATPLALRCRLPWLLIALAFGAWCLVSSFVLLEVPIKEALCPYVDLACRPSKRNDVWQATAQLIAQHPLWGSGYAFRFTQGVTHAHNAYLGMALHYGVPLLLLFIALMATALYQATQIASAQTKFFVASTLVFANGYMGSDLSDPMRFFNTHYLFLWFPLFLALLSVKSDNGVAPTPRE